MKSGSYIGRSIYGVIITATLLVTLQHFEDSPWDMVATILLTLLAVAVSEYYAQAYARGFAKGSRLERRDTSEILLDCIHMFYGSVIPVVIFVAAGLGILHISAAFALAELSVGVLLVAYGYLYGRTGGHSRGRSVLYGLVNVGLVAGIILLKSLFH